MVYVDVFKKFLKSGFGIGNPFPQFLFLRLPRSDFTRLVSFLFSKRHFFLFFAAKGTHTFQSVCICLCV